MGVLLKLRCFSGGGGDGGGNRSGGGGGDKGDGGGDKGDGRNFGGGRSGVGSDRRSGGARSGVGGSFFVVVLLREGRDGQTDRWTDRRKMAREKEKSLEQKCFLNFPLSKFRFPFLFQHKPKSS